MTMVFYSGWQYLLIDAATQFGLDKLTFEERIEWAETHLDRLEGLVTSCEAKTKPLYLKAVQAIRKAQQGIPTGHMIGLDATCSGIQIMSALTGCHAGALATGLVDPNVRADAYTSCTEAMNTILGGNLDVPRESAKRSLMTSFYGSKQEPKNLFGADTPELNAFYEAAQTIAPGAWELLQDLLGSWQPYALEHRWVLPDGFEARIKVMQKTEARIEVDELDHATFTYEYYENQGSKKGLSNAANVVHSVDAYILRTMHRRCNYDRVMVEDASNLIEIGMIERSLGLSKPIQVTELSEFVWHYNRSGIVDVSILPFLSNSNVKELSQEHLEKLAAVVNGMLQYQPFPLITVHDEFKAHPNNLNWVRWQYKEILAELAESNLIEDILNQIHGVPGTFNKLSNNLGDVIRNSAYALC